MLNYKDIFLQDPFSKIQKKKDFWYFKYLKELSYFHYNNCIEYKKITDQLFEKISKSKKIIDLPYLPVELFKKKNLKSTANKNLSRVLRSSGTTGNETSKINLDRKTSLIQSRALSIILSNIIDIKKNDIFFVDSPDVLKLPLLLSARGAGISGFKQMAKKSYFLLNKNFELNFDILTNFIKKNPNKKFIIFGFTSFIWERLVLILKNKKINLKKNNGILIHGGGWKKLQDQSVNRDKFNLIINKKLGINTVYNYYGMVEQTGSIFLECEHGFFHPSIFSEILIRNKNLDLCKINEEGLIQVTSLLPLSYPGHNILTEDLGSLKGIDNCECGRKGKFFKINGRVPGTVIRGCSDVY